MAIKELPIFKDDLKFEYKTTINGVEYWFYYRFNQRAKRWVVNLYTSEREPIVTGIFVLENNSLYQDITLKNLNDLEIFTYVTQNSNI